MPYVVRQYVLNLGYREGSTDMIEAERRIMLRVSMEMARQEISVSGTAVGSKEPTKDTAMPKVEIPAIELNKGELAKLKRSRGESVHVIVTPNGAKAPNLKKLKEG